ncbi:hypothetical protein JL721_8308 [Aureococcus anophagefferens]|nr:hypothetical protein JL721_8308 [Aureococcus anophagefferens]
MRPVCLLLATLGSAAALPRPFVVLSGLAVAAAACTSNSDCSSGEFCNSADNPECEACYYPGDLPRSVDACARYEDACGAACDGSGGGNSGDGDAEDGSGGNGDPDGGNLPEGCCSEVMEPHQQCVYPTDSTYDRDEVKEPVVSSEALEFATHDDCAAHDAYADCVGETAERCHWVFLSSPKGGFCRVDPISKCLELGNCVCNTEDFQGGGADLGGGIVFHAPVSVTPRDVAPGSRVTSYSEAATPPVDGADELHPRDEAFFVSRVDFTAKTLTYELSSPFPADSTVLFKLHHLYRDQRLRGTLYDGPGLSVTVASEADGSAELAVNGHAYAFPAAALKTWHCNQIAVTPSRVYVRDLAIARDLDAEAAPAAAPRAVLGPASAELFDVRVYAGALSADEIATVGARCGDPGELKMLIDLETEFLRGGCNPDVDGVPSNEGIQTYGSGAFGTLWVAPAEYGTEWWTTDFDEVPPGTNANFNSGMFDELVAGDLYDLTEEMLDLDHYFQEQKMLSHVWEKYYFETDMMAVNLAPFSAYASASEVPGHSARDWNNPCRFLHQHNNGWLFPFYGSAIEKWEPTDDAAVFDLRSLYRNRGHSGYGFVVHEVFHGFQGELCGTDSWTYGGDSNKNCAWVAKNPGARCSLEGDGIFGSSTLEDLQTTVAVSGATAGSVAAPAASRPGPFGWNALKLDGFDAGDFVTITVAWDDLVTDDATANPAALNKVHASCVNDRFFSARVVRLGADGVRTYWKMDGKNPDPVTVKISVGDVVHVLLVPTPPADYVDHPERLYDTFEPVPHYGYGYEVAVADSGSETAAADMAYGVLAYADRGDWFETRCTCLTLSEDLSDCWAPRFAAADNADAAGRRGAAPRRRKAAAAAARPGVEQRVDVFARARRRARRDDRVPVLGAPTTTPAPPRAPTTTTAATATTTTTAPTTTTTTAAACANDESWKTPPGGVGCAKQTKAGKCKKKGCKWTKQFKKCSKQKARSCSKLFKKYDKKKAKGKMKAKDYSKLATLCETMGAADIEASVGCPASCGTCPTPTPTTAGVGAVVGETTTTVGFEGGGNAKWDPCKKKKTKKRCKKKKNKRGKKKCCWNPRKEKCTLKKKKQLPSRLSPPLRRPGTRACANLTTPAPSRARRSARRA